jgi:hypothetical protein
MRYEWTPASEPPNNSRSVLAWMSSIDEWCEAFYRRGRWYKHGWEGVQITHWRDVAPPDVPESVFRNMAGGE